MFGMCLDVFGCFRCWGMFLVGFGWFYKFTETFSSDLPLGFQDNISTEHKYSRTRLWMEYVSDEQTRPVPFNLLPTIDGIKRFFSTAWNIFSNCNCHRKELEVLPNFKWTYGIIFWKFENSIKKVNYRWYLIFFLVTVKLPRFCTTHFHFSSTISDPLALISPILDVPVETFMLFSIYRYELVIYYGYFHLFHYRNSYWVGRERLEEDTRWYRLYKSNFIINVISKCTK